MGHIARDFWVYYSNCPPNVSFRPETRTVVQKVKDLKRFVCVNNHPCMITKTIIPIDPSTRQYDRTKLQFVAIDIFTGEVFKATFPRSGTCVVPIVILTDYQLVEINEKDSHVTLLDNKGYVRQDLMLPPDQDLLSEVKFGLMAEGKDVFVSVASAMGKEKIVASKLLKTKW